MSGIIRVQGRSDTVCSGVPPLDESLAAHLLPRSAGWAEGKKPLPLLPRDREALEYLDKMFRLGSQMAAAANNLGVLGVSLITPRADAPALPSQDGEDYPDRCIGQMNNLIHGVATAAGRVMSLATVASRHVWLGLTALPKKDRAGLLGAPVFTEGLFGSIASVTQRFSRLEEERLQLSRMLPLASPQVSQRPPRAAERSAAVRRRERRRYEGPVPVAPSATSTSPVGPAYRHSRGRAARPRQSQQQQRTAGWGAPPKRS